MAVTSSGQISLGDMRTEFGDSGEVKMSDYYSQGSAPASGEVQMSDFYGAANVFAFSISTNQTNASLTTLATSAGWDGSSPIEATINSGIYIYGTTTGNTALTISGVPSGSTLINNGFIVGDGGNGGTGGGPASAGSTGGSAGKALNVTSAISIDNQGTIAGGGGGGGGGGSIANSNEGASGGGGGGGRSGLTNSSGGAGGTPRSGFGNTAGSPGGAGTSSAAGSGGSRGTFPNGNYRGGNGGSGGGWGSNGSSGASGNAPGGYSVYGGGSGGSGGAAITGNSYVTWVTTGTRLGSIS